MRQTKCYDGIDQDPKGAMNRTGNIIRDAWVFDIIPETETRARWTVQAIDSQYDKVSAGWEPYGHLASQLPVDLRQRHEWIYREAMERTKSLGWDPSLGDD